MVGCFVRLGDFDVEAAGSLEGDFVVDSSDYFRNLIKIILYIISLWPNLSDSRLKLITYKRFNHLFLFDFFYRLDFDGPLKI